MGADSTVFGPDWRMSVLPSHSSFKPCVRLCAYPDLIFWAGQTFNNPTPIVESLSYLAIALLYSGSGYGFILIDL
jgi:hypothetical protein